MRITIYIATFFLLSFVPVEAQSSLGLGTGIFGMKADVASKIVGANLGAIQWRYHLTKSTFVKTEFVHAIARGQDDELSRNPEFGLGGRLIEPDYQAYAESPGLLSNYKTRFNMLSLSLSISPFLESLEDEYVSLKYLSIHFGVAMSYHKTSLNLLDENGAIYTGSDQYLYDDTFESVFSIENQNYSMMLNFGMETKFPFALGTELFISAEVFPQFSDYLDGIMYRTKDRATRSNDLPYYAGVGILYKLNEVEESPRVNTTGTRTKTNSSKKRSSSKKKKKRKKPGTKKRN